MAANQTDWDRSPSTRSGTGRVLVVDDEKDFCQILFLLFKSEGFEPMVAHDGESALEMIRTGLPDAVLLDVRMPGMDGFEVLKRSKEMQPNLPVLLMTAFGGLERAVEGLKAGAWDYLPKPIDNRELVNKLRQAIAETEPLGKTVNPTGHGRDKLGLKL
ncbi:MAG: response regulator, partial [Deltaproteobacteria bacterium]|nr:response regulator [Deltaproteobacteria bacterium]